MKKTYISPELMVMAIATQEMIATSLESMGLEGGDVTLSTESANDGDYGWSRDSGWDD